MYIENVTESRDGGDGRKERREIKYEVTKRSVKCSSVCTRNLFDKNLCIIKYFKKYERVCTYTLFPQQFSNL